MNGAHLAGLVAAVGALAAPANILAQCGLSWHTFGSGPSSAGVVSDVAVGANGDLYIAGLQWAGVQRWNGTAWVPLGTVAPMRLLARSNGDLLAGSTPAATLGFHSIVRWDGTAWQPFATWLNHWVLDLIELGNGDVVAAGRFTSALGAGVLNRVARWDGSAWHAFGGGIDHDVYALAVLPNGELIAAGYFTLAGGVPAHNVARWDGSAWHALGAGPALDMVDCVLVTGPNEVLVGGHMNGPATTTSLLQRWNGTAWQPVGPAWPAGNALQSLLRAPNGDILAGVFGAGPVAGFGGTVLRWNGTTWTSLAPTPWMVGNHFDQLAAMPDGSAVVGGAFVQAAGLVANGVIRLASTCAATATVSGTACPGGGGANLYEPITLPWTGSVYRARSTTIAPHALVAAVTGFATTTLPLSSVLPPSPAGCDVLVSPVLVDLFLGANGQAHTNLAIPSVPSLAGLVVHQQLVVLELDPQLVFVQSTASNRITATIGVF